ETWIVVGKADVVRQCVEPDVSDEIFIERKLNSPVEPRFRTRDAKIAADFLDSISQFGLTKIGNDCIFAILEISKQPFFVLTELKVVIFLFAKLDLPPLRAEFAVGTTFLVSKKLLLTNRVIPGLFVLVDLAFIEEPLQNSSNDFLVAITDRLRPVVVLHVELFPEIDKLL